MSQTGRGTADCRKRPPSRSSAIRQPIRRTLLPSPNADFPTSTSAPASGSPRARRGLVQATARPVRTGPHPRGRTRGKPEGKSGLARCDYPTTDSMVARPVSRLRILLRQQRGSEASRHYGTLTINCRRQIDPSAARADSCGKLGAPVLGVGPGPQSATVPNWTDHPIHRWSGSHRTASPSAVGASETVSKGCVRVWKS